MKKLLFENAQLIASETASITNDITLLNKLQAFFDEHRLGKLDYDVIQNLLSNPARFISNVIKSRIPDCDPHTGLKVDKEKMISAMQLPQVNEDLLYLIGINVVHKDHLSLFDFGDTVELNEDRIDKYMDKYRVFADNPAILIIYDELKAVEKRLNELNDKLELMPITAHTYGDSEFFFKSMTQIFSVTPDGLKLRAQGFQQAVALLLKRVKVN